MLALPQSWTHSWLTYGKGADHYRHPYTIYHPAPVPPRQMAMMYSSVFPASTRIRCCSSRCKKERNITKNCSKNITTRILFAVCIAVSISYMSSMSQFFKMDDPPSRTASQTLPSLGSRRSTCGNFHAALFITIVS